MDTNQNKLVWDFKEQFMYYCKVFLSDSFIFVPTVIAIYMLFVLKIGPDYMKSRQPYKLNKLIVVYNILQVVGSIYLFSLGVNYSKKYGIVFTKCNLEENFKHVNYMANCYVVAKLSEFLDTIFFVLRKKQNQISFLHVYHHVLMATTFWLALKYDISENGIFIGMINSFVHIIMYGYYCLSAIPGTAKYLWWKKYITTIQLLQFAFIFIHMAISYKVSPCPLSNINVYLVLFNTLVFIYLFSDFYVKSYKTKKTKTVQEEINHNDVETPSKYEEKIDTRNHEHRVDSHDDGKSSKKIH